MEACLVGPRGLLQWHIRCPAIGQTNSFVMQANAMQDDSSMLITSEQQGAVRQVGHLSGGR